MLSQQSKYVKTGLGVSSLTLDHYNVRGMYIYAVVIAFLFFNDSFHMLLIICRNNMWPQRVSRYSITASGSTLNMETQQELVWTSFTLQLICCWEKKERKNLFHFPFIAAVYRTRNLTWCWWGNIHIVSTHNTKQHNTDEDGRGFVPSDIHHHLHLSSEQQRDVTSHSRELKELGSSEAAGFPPAEPRGEAAAWNLWQQLQQVHQMKQVKQVKQVWQHDCRGILN